MVSETGNRNRILEVCEFRIWFRLTTILYRFSPNFASGSGMWAHRRLFVRQTGSSLPILEMCGFRFRQFSGYGDHMCQQISTKSHVRINSAMPTLYSMMNETGNRNQILETCKFRFKLVHWIDPSSIEHNYACYQFFCACWPWMNTHARFNKRLWQSVHVLADNKSYARSTVCWKFFLLYSKWTVRKITSTTSQKSHVLPKSRKFERFRFKLERPHSRSHLPIEHKNATTNRLHFRVLRCLSFFNQSTAFIAEKGTYFHHVTVKFDVRP